MKEYGTGLHRALEIISWLILAVSFLIAVFGLFTLPDTIATHFNIRGEADGYGSPAELFLIPVFMGISLLIISLSVHFVKPGNWNVPTEVRRRKRKAVYRSMLTMCSLVQLEISGFTLFMQILMYHGTVKGIGIGMAVFISALFLTIVLLSVKINRENKRYD